MLNKIIKTQNFRLSLAFMLVLTIVFSINIVNAENYRENVYNEVNIELQHSIKNQNKNLSIAERYESLNIEKNKLSAIDTEDLINLILEYPLLGNIFAYDNLLEGLSVIEKEFNPIKELIHRNDAKKLIENRLNNSELKKDFIKTSFLKTLQEYILSNGYYNVNETQKASQTTVKTPKGTSVTVLMRGEELTTKEKNDINAYFDSTYPNATRIGSATTNYNCHSYAWYSASTSNKYWMNYPTAYMSDGSYIKVSSTQSKKVYYPNGGSSHSGLYVAGTITSKWGQAGLYKHSLSHCPYKTSGVVYYKLNTNLPKIFIDM